MVSTISNLSNIIPQFFSGTKPIFPKITRFGRLFSDQLQTAKPPKTKNLPAAEGFLGENRDIGCEKIIQQKRQ